MRPQVYEPLTPAVWLLRSAWICPAIGSRVSAYCNIQAGRISDWDKFTVVPSSSSGSTSWGSCATSPDVAVRNCATRPGGLCYCVEVCGCLRQLTDPYVA